MPDAPGGETQVHNPAGDMALVRYRLDQIEQKLDRVINDHEGRLRHAEDAVARVQEQLRIITAVLVALNVIASAVAAWLGSVAK